MKVLIIEDEILTSRRLRQLILAADDAIEIVDVLDSIESSVEWFGSNSVPDLVFMDIQLSDGLCFEIFNRVNVDCPVVFTTAFDEYAIQAFRVNSIDYLLKPVKPDDVIRSLEKYNKLKNQYVPSFSSLDFREILRNMSGSRPIYKSRFLVKTGQSFIRVDCKDIAYFHTENKLTYIILFNGRKYLADHTLDLLEKELDPSVFFRISRQFIVSINSVESVHLYFGGSLKLNITPAIDDEVIVSRRRTVGFREWMDQ